MYLIKGGTSSDSSICTLEYQSKMRIILSQMRLQFSNLRCHLYEKQCISSPLCLCGEANESVSHYFYNCTKFTTARLQFHRELFITLRLNQISPLEHFLHGDPQRTPEENRKLIQLVCAYIKDTNRF